MGSEEIYVKGFYWGNPKERGHSLDLGVEEMVVIKCILDVIWCVSAGWINLAQETNQCYSMCNGPTNSLVCNKTLIQILHVKTLKITPTCFDHQLIIIRELI
jgi:hypothetical protein